MLLEMTRLGGTYNDGYADNLFFDITVVPEPRQVAVTGALGLLAWAARRRSRQR